MSHPASAVTATSPRRLNPAPDPSPAGSQDHRFISIATASTPASRASANDLLNRRYGWRGYEAVSLPNADSGRHYPLTATHDNEVIGTLTVGIDGPHLLNCDRTFSDEVAELRRQGRRLCEFTKLAIDQAYGSKHVLAALFHVAYLAADRMARVDTLLMEVNPRHVRYYSRILGARVIGQERTNATVNAPAVLLVMAFADVRSKIDGIAGSPHRVGDDRSLYSLAFNPREEEAIVDRLIRHACGDSDGVVPFGFRLPMAQTPGAIEH